MLILHHVFAQNHRQKLSAARQQNQNGAGKQQPFSGVCGIQAKPQSAGLLAHGEKPGQHYRGAS